MRANLFILCLLALIVETLAFGYSNYQIPMRITKRERYYKTWGRTIDAIGVAMPATDSLQYRSTQCVDKTQCETLNKIMPLWKFRAGPIDTFKPLNGQVLIGFDQDDEGNAAVGVQPVVTNTMTGSFTTISGDGGIEQDLTTQAALYTGIVVSASNDIVSPNITEGARVYFSQRCTVRWTAFSWAAIYGPEKAASMEGKFKNGVDLNNAEGWRFTRTTADTAFPFTGPNPSNAFVWPDSTNPATSADHQFYPGYAGTQFDTFQTAGHRTGMLTTTTAMSGKDGDMPLFNPGQQPTYLLCLESDVMGVIKEQHFANLDGRHYIKPKTVNRGQNLPYNYNLRNIFKANNPAANIA
jgi:hypothetical protein